MQVSSLDPSDDYDSIFDDDRRKFIGWLARILMATPLVAGATTKLKPTPAVTVGPFYPPQPMGLPFFGAKPLNPLPEGNDLTIGPSGKRSEGEKISLSGRVMNTAGQVLPESLLTFRAPPYPELSGKNHG